MGTTTLLILALFVVSCQARTAFEKMTDVDYQGETYYTIRNLSLYECQGWCREEVECQAASFSFVANGLGQQETVCLLQNGTQANNPTSKPIQARNQYYMVKMSIRSDKVCKRPWNFERVPNSIIQGHDRALIFTSTKEACLAACLNERNFICRSAEYNYVTLQCRLSDYDRRTLSDNVQSVGVIEAQGVDYFENLCLNNDDACADERSYQPPRFGQPAQKVAAHVKTHFYVDKELMANSMAACNRACTVEAEFLCRSFLFLGPPTGTEYNCKLYHMDHWSLPDGVGAFLNSNNNFGSSNLGIDIPTNSGSSLINEAIDPDINCDRLGTCYDVSVHCKDTRIVVNVNTNQAFSGRIYALGRSETCNVDVINSDSFRLDLTMSGQDCNTQSVAGVYTNTVVVQRHSVVMTKTDKIYKVRCTYDTTSRNITFGMMPIRDPDMISITSAPEAPAPKIRILDSRQQEVETVRIGDRLTFRIEIPDKTPYGIFARSCVAMAKDARSTFPIIDEQGCPSDPSIFPRFTPEGNALLSVYEAFRFTESYGVIFQCNVKYCLGPCQPVSCNYGRDNFESWGRRRKRREVQLPANVIDNEVDTQMRLSHEIIVLDFGDEKTSPFDFDTPTTSAANHNGNNTRVTRLDWNEMGDVGEEPLLEDCPTRSTVMGLAVACALLVVVYLCTVFCLCIRPPGGATGGAKPCVLPPEHIPGRNSNLPTATLSRQYVR